MTLPQGFAKTHKKRKIDVNDHKEMLAAAVKLPFDLLSNASNILSKDKGKSQDVIRF